MGSMRLLWHSRLRRDASLLLTLQTFYRLSGVLLLAVLSRSLPAGDIGVYFFALSFAEAFTVLASFCLNPVLMRRVAADPAQASAHFSSLLGIRLVSSPLYLLCVSAAAMVFAGAIWRLIVIVALFTLLENTYFAFGHLFLALKRVDYNVGIGMVVQVVFLGVFLLGMWWSPGLDVLLQANLLRALCLLGAALFVTHRWLGLRRLTWDSSLIKEGAPFILLTLLAILRGKLDTLLLGFFTDYDTVGQYHLAFRVVFTFFFVPMAIGQALFPQLAAHGLSGENRRMLMHCAGLLFGAGLLGMGVLLLGAVPLTTVLYGPLAGEVAPLLRPLALLLPLSFLHLFLSTALQALHQETKVLRALTISTGIHVLANCTLIPLFGAYGAVGAGVVSAAMQLGMLVWHFRHLLTQIEPLGKQQPENQNLSLPIADLE